MRKKLGVLFVVITMVASCKQNEVMPKLSPEELAIRDTLQVSRNMEDIAANEYLNEELQPIRANFKRINSIVAFDKVIVDNYTSINAVDEGEVIFYYSKNELQKVTNHQYESTQQYLTEYYLLNGKLSFAFNKTLEYNAPYNSDQFDLSKSELIEDRYYFKDDVLLHQLNSQDCGAPFESEYLKAEGENVLSIFKALL
ncbi:hypothetical protein [Myroides injenensis]|uniref:hypothetical protein n=1 Tax=Myroides injenensis TaxID=1183151 RepID=UPI0002DDB8AC|nr:hypothetical protein [Myroides injenensis]